MKENITNVQNYDYFEQSSEVLISSNKSDSDFDSCLSWFLATYKEGEDYYPIDINSNV